MDINQQIDLEFKTYYKQLTNIEYGIDFNFTEYQNIELTARLIVFWKYQGKKHNLILKRVKEYQKLLKEMNKLGKEFKEKVMKRIEDFSNPERCKEIEEIKKRLITTFQIAEKLYEEAKEYIAPNDIDLFKPSILINNQDDIRKTWPIFKKEIENPETNSFYKYMDFMYNSYPEGFGSEIARCVQEYNYADGAEIYYKLTKSSTNNRMSINKTS